MITSAANKKIKNVSALLLRARERRKQGTFVVEGIKMFTEAPSDWIREIYIEETLFQKVQSKKAETGFSEKLTELLKKGKAKSEIEIVKDEIFRKMSDTQTPQGILCVMKQPEYSPKQIFEGKEGNGLYLLLEDIQDPGNLGTMLRAGEGAGVNGVIMSDRTVDIFNPKTIRATMGSIYRVPFCYVGDLEPCIREMQKRDIRVYAAHLKGKQNYDRFDYRQSVAFLIGNEGNGLQDETAKLADAYLTIPMLGQVESLNAAIAATLLSYEVARQRRNELI